MTVTFKLTKIGPAEAKALLEHNSNNRKPKLTSIDKFARDMENGRWHQLLTPILLARPDEDGNEQLLDGQNRLMAVIQANVVIEFMVAHGLEPDVQAVVDSGNSRKVGDTLYMQGGVRQANSVAAVARLLWSLRQLEDDDSAIFSTRITPTNQEILDVVKESPAILQAVEAVGGSYKRTRLSPSNAALVYYFGCLKDPEMTQKFFEKLISGTGNENEPVVALRNRLLHKTNGHLDRWQQLFLTLRALTATRNGQEMTRLQLPTSRRVSAREVINEINELTKELPGGRR